MSKVHIQDRVHDYDTVVRFAESLTAEHVLVGDCAGLSAVYGVEKSPTLRGYLRVQTEHGYIYARPTDEFEVAQFPPAQVQLLPATHLQRHFEAQVQFHPHNS